MLGHGKQYMLVIVMKYVKTVKWLNKIPPL